MPELTPTILVVQRSEPPIDCFLGLLREILPSSRIGVTETVEGGMELIEVIGRAGTVYDVAVVDIEPLSQKKSQGISDGLCEILKKKMPETLVIHTGLAEVDEEPVWSHLKRDHRRQLLTSYVCRSHEDWMIQTITQIKEWLCGRLIATQLASLQQAIIDHWDDLDADLQRRIKSIFNVDLTIHPIRLSLP